MFILVLISQIVTLVILLLFSEWANIWVMFIFTRTSPVMLYRRSNAEAMCVLVVMFHMGDSPTKRESFKARSKKISSAEIVLFS